MLATTVVTGTKSVLTIASYIHKIAYSIAIATLIKMMSFIHGHSFRVHRRRIKFAGKGFSLLGKLNCAKAEAACQFYVCTIRDNGLV